MNHKEKAREWMEQMLKLNKRNYSIRIGEKVKIYYSTNSCCPFCSPRLKHLKSVRFKGSLLEINPDEACDGCNVLSSINFTGVKKGIDTIHTQIISPHQNCDSINELKDFKLHIIHIYE